MQWRAAARPGAGLGAWLPDAGGRQRREEAWRGPVGTNDGHPANEMGDGSVPTDRRVGRAPDGALLTTATTARPCSPTRTRP